MKLGLYGWLASLLLVLGPAPVAAARAARPVPTHAPAPETAAGLHAKIVAAARTVLPSLEAFKAARAGGLGPAYSSAGADYETARGYVVFLAREQAALDPSLRPLEARIDDAQRALRATAAAPDSVELDLVRAQQRLTDATAAREAALQALTDQVMAGLAPLGLGLPDPRSREMWAAGQTGDIGPFVPPPVGVWGSDLITPFHAAPWQVELQWDDVDDHQPPFPPTELHHCGGALIRADWVLTAAHCVWDATTGKIDPRLRVRAGSADLAGGMQRYRIDAVFLPDKPHAYRVSTRTAPALNDIALLRVTPDGPPEPPPAEPARSFTLITDAVVRGVAAVELASPAAVVPARKRALSVSGWGAATQQTLAQQDQREAAGGRLAMNRELSVAPLTLISNAACSDRVRRRIREGAPGAAVADIPPTTLCAGSAETGTCLGDSGGPLVAHLRPRRAARASEPPPPSAGSDVDDSSGARSDDDPPDRPVLVGLVSWGVGCTDFTVFTRVSAYRAWIDSVIARNEPPAAASAVGRRR